MKALLRWTHALVPTDRFGWNLAAGLRAATAVALPVLLGEIFGMPAISWLAIVAFWGCIVDTGGAWRDRFAAQASFALAATIGVVLALAAARSVWLAVPFAFAWSIVAGMLRIYGNPAGAVGNLTTVCVLVTLGIPARSQAEILERAGLTLAGGLWAMLLVLILWRVYPHGPARRAVALCWRQLGEYAAALSRLQLKGEGDDWEQVARRHRRTVREAIEAARTVLTRDQWTVSSNTARGRLLFSLLADADQVFDGVIALSELLESEQATLESAGRALRVALRRVGRRAAAIARLPLDPRPEQPSRVAPAAAALAHLAGSAIGPDLAPTVHVLQHIDHLLDSAAEPASSVRAPKRLAEAMMSRSERDPTTVRDLFGSLRANIGFRSLVFRHALRLAITVAAGQAAVMLLALQRGYWVTITATIILQPQASLTWRRSFERVAGSVLGGGIAALITAVTKEPVAIALVVFPLSVITMAVRAVNYTLFVFALTPLFILIAELFQPGGPASVHLAGLRVVDTVLGGALALMAGVLLWPAREAPHLPDHLARSVQALNRYLAAVLEEDQDDSAVHAARRDTGLAVNNAEVSVERIASEPMPRNSAAVRPASTIIAVLRRLAGIAAALAHLRRSDPLVLPRRERLSLLTWLSESLGIIEQAISHREPPGLIPRLDPEVQATAREGRSLVSRELQRLQDQIELAHAAAGRLAAAAGATIPPSTPAGA